MVLFHWKFIILLVFMYANYKWQVPFYSVHNPAIYFHFSPYSSTICLHYDDFRPKLHHGTWPRIWITSYDITVTEQLQTRWVLGGINWAGFYWTMIYIKILQKDVMVSSHNMMGNCLSSSEFHNLIISFFFISWLA